MTVEVPSIGGRAQRAMIGAGLLSLLLGGCAIFPPVGDLPRARLASGWSARAYTLEALAYHPTEPGSPAWMRSAETPPGGIVVVPRRDRVVSAFEADTGRLIWDLPLGGPIVARPVEIPGAGELLVAGMDGTVMRVQQRNGRVVWKSAEAGYAIVSAPVVVTTDGGLTGQVLVTSLDNRVTALSLESGARLWSVQRADDAELTIAGQGGALVREGRVYAGFSDGVLGAWALEDGATLWTADLAGKQREFVDIDSTPILVAGEDGEALVIVSVFKRGVFAVTADGGDIAWQVRGEAFGSPVHMDGLVVVTQATGRAYGLDAATGKVRWVSDLGTRWAGTPTLSARYVFVPTGADLAVLDKGSGRVVERWNDGRGVTGTPDFAWGRLFVSTNAGLVHGVDVY